MQPLGYTTVAEVERADTLTDNSPQFGDSSLNITVLIRSEFVMSSDVRLRFRVIALFLWCFCWYRGLVFRTDQIPSLFSLFLSVLTVDFYPLYV